MATQAAPPPEATVPPRPSIGDFAFRFLSVRELGPFVLLILLFVIFSTAKDSFRSALNLANVLEFIPEIGIMALGMTLLMTAGEIDLTVGAYFGFTPVFLFLLYNSYNVPFELACLIGLLITAGFGLLNGLLVTKVRITSLITTIAMMLIVRGFALYISNGFPQTSFNNNSWIASLLIGKVFTIGEDFTLLASMLWMIGIAVVLHLILTRTRFGNWISATGGNIKSARARAVPTDRVKILMFILTAVLSGFAGIIDSLRLKSAYPIAGTGYELEVIAMVVIGGTSLLGGRGTIIGTFIGVFLLRILQNGIIIVGVPGLAYNIFVGGIILVMMTLYAIIERRQLGEN